MTNSVKRPLLVGALIVIATSVIPSPAQADVLTPAAISSAYETLIVSEYGAGALASSGTAAVACEVVTLMACTIPMVAVGALVAGGTAAYVWLDPLAYLPGNSMNPTLFKTQQPGSFNPGYSFVDQTIIPAGAPGSPANVKTIRFTVITPKPSTPIDYAIYEFLGTCTVLACAEPAIGFSSSQTPFVYASPFGMNPKALVVVTKNPDGSLCLVAATCFLQPVGEIGNIAVPTAVNPPSTFVPPTEPLVPTKTTKIDYWWETPDGVEHVTTLETPYIPGQGITLDPNAIPEGGKLTGVGIYACTTGSTTNCNVIMAPTKIQPETLPDTTTIPKTVTTDPLPNPKPPVGTSPSTPSATKVCNGTTVVASAVCVPPPSDSCGFDILAPTSWVKCLFVPTPKDLHDLMNKFNLFLAGSAIGQIKDFTLQLIDPITSGWSAGGEGCAGIAVDFDYIIASSAAIHFHEHPFSTCNPGFVQDMAKDWALPLQSFVVIFGTFVTVTNMILRALSLGESMWHYTPGTPELNWINVTRSPNDAIGGGASRDSIGGGSSRRSLTGMPRRLAIAGRKAISGRRNRKAIKGSPKRKELN